MNASSLKPSRFRISLCLLTTSALLPLSACGSGNSQPQYVTSTKIDCGGKQSLTASGSTAQANAIPVFIDAYQNACPGHTLTYTSNGSGAGVTEFIGDQTDFGGQTPR